MGGGKKGGKGAWEAGKGAWEAGKGVWEGGKGSWEAGKGSWEAGEWDGKGWGVGGKGASETGQWTWQPYNAASFADAWEYGKGGSSGSAAGTSDAQLPVDSSGGGEPLDEEAAWHRAVGGKGAASRRADQRMAEERQL